MGLLFVLLFGAMSEQNVMVCRVINADFVNEEAPNGTVIPSRWQQILVRHCIASRDQSYIRPNMLKTFLERVFPTEHHPATQRNGCFIATKAQIPHSTSASALWTIRHSAQSLFH